MPKSVTIKVDVTPPEASIAFSLAARDIVITGHDNLSQVVVNDIGQTVRLNDEAGNTTELIFSEFHRQRGMRASLQTIRYNGVDGSSARNIFYYRWTYDRRGRLVELIQYVRSRGDFTIKAIYGGLRNRTLVQGRDAEQGRVRAQYQGLMTISIRTNKGDFDYQLTSN